MRPQSSICAAWMLRANVTTAATNARVTWSSALEDAIKSGNKLLQWGCEGGLQKVETPDVMELIVRGKYPNLVAAQYAYDSAQSEFKFLSNFDFGLSDEELGRTAAVRVRVLATAQEVRNAWVIARNDANKVNDTALEKFCETQLSKAEERLRQANTNITADYYQH
jgi:hypothetical protein